MRRILVFDESGNIVNEISKCFKMFYDITEAQSSEEALSILDTDRFDVLLLGLGDNIYSAGFDVLRKINQNSRTPSFLVIGIVDNGPAYQDTFLDGMELGADDCMARPIYPKILLVKLEKMLSNIY